MEKLMRSFTKKFGEGSIRYLADPSIVPSALGYVPSGILPVDYVLGVPGVPLGRIVEIYGYESTGKSAVLASLLGMCQAMDGIAILVDSEHSYSSDWSTLFTVDPNKLILMQPAHLQEAGEQIIFICEELRKENPDVPVLIGIDSVAALPVVEELDRDTETHAVGLHARVLSRILRQITNLIWERRVAVVAINQQKERPPMGPAFAPGVSKIGGHSLDYHCCTQLRLSRTQILRDKGKVRGITIRIFGAKNKVAPPFRESTCSFYFDAGFDDFDFLLPLAVELGLVERKGGGWYVWGDRKFQKNEFVSLGLEREIVSKYYGDSLGEVVYGVRQLRARNIDRGVPDDSSTGTEETGEEGVKGPFTA